MDREKQQVPLLLYPGFPVELVGVGELHAVFLKESPMRFYISHGQIQNLRNDPVFGESPPWCFVSGHDFSRAVKETERKLGFRVCVRASIFGQNQYDCVLMSTQNQYEYCVIFEFSRRL